MIADILGSHLGSRFVRTVALSVVVFTAAANCHAGEDSSPDTVSVFQFIPRNQQSAIVAGTSRYDATLAIHAARDAVNGTGKTLVFPAGTYYVGEVRFSGSNYRIRSEDVTFRQRPGLTRDDQLHPIITFPQDARNIQLGNIALVGNIATDRGEYAPGIAVLSADDIRIGDVRGRDIRGDVLYTYGRTTSEAEYQRNLVTGVISGSNIYRCIVAMAGGDATIAGIVQDGGVGYRDFDVEPNKGGAYQPVSARVGFIRGSTVQITSDDPDLINQQVRIDRLELDGTRLADSVPGFYSHGGANALALGIGRIDRVSIGRLQISNYRSFPIALADRWRAIDIDSFSFHNAGTTENIYKSIIIQIGKAGKGVLRIGSVEGQLADSSRMLLRSDIGLLQVEVGQSHVAGGKIGYSVAGRVGNVRLTGGLQ